jgi:hypothetical protein
MLNPNPSRILSPLRAEAPDEFIFLLELLIMKIAIVGAAALARCLRHTVVGADS